MAFHCVFSTCDHIIRVSAFVGEWASEEIGKAHSANPRESAQIYHLAEIFTFLFAVCMLPNMNLVQPEGFYGKGAFPGHLTFFIG